MFEPGKIVNGRYKVLSLLGEGGMGSVYLAEHVDVGRKVAIKLLRAQFADDTRIVERFQREARAAAAIGHDNIVDVIDFGRSDGLPYMVMEHLRGESLRSLLDRRGRLEVQRTADIMVQTLAALYAAHEAGIVHRDLKPDNVFLTSRAGTKDFVKLLDFGISKFRSKQPLGDNWETQPGVVIGTVFYMAPEQLLAKGDADHRVDIHSAGVVLYEMLTGWLPFEEESQAEAIMQIVYRPRPLRKPTELVEDVPADLEGIVLRALEPDPADRFPNAAEFARALSAFASQATRDAVEDMLRKHSASERPPSVRPASRRRLEDTPTEASVETPQAVRETIRARPNARTPEPANDPPEPTAPVASTTPVGSTTPVASVTSVASEPAPPRRRFVIATSVAAATLAALVIALTMSSSTGARNSAPRATAGGTGAHDAVAAAGRVDAGSAVPTGVMVSVRSDPTGATVRDARDGTVLCEHTPCAVAVVGGARRVLVARDGATVEVALEASIASYTVPLAAAATTNANGTATTSADAAATSVHSDAATLATSSAQTERRDAATHRRRRRDDPGNVEVPLFAPH